MVNDEDKILKKYRRELLADPAAMVPLNYGRPHIEMIVPYRDPFLLIDKLTALDLPGGILAGSRFLSPDLPLFAGHFPGFPVYPGSLQIETIGQLGLCLYHFAGRKTEEINGPQEPMNIRAVRVGGAYYRSPVEPGNEITILAKVLDYDGYFGTVLGQIAVEGTVATTALLEVAFLD